MPAPRFGFGFRTRYAAELLDAPPPVDWLEVVSEHVIGVGGPRRATLERLRSRWPIALHGVSLSIAGSSPLAHDYLRDLRALVDWVEPACVSDHLCWTALGAHESHDLLPVAYTHEVLDHVASRVARVQDALGRRLLLENATAYVAFRPADMDEPDFLAALTRRTGCGVLLDVNNLVVNAANLGVEPMRYVEALPRGVVGYVHLAGHAVLPDVRIDTHDADVPPPVWALFDAVVRRFPEADVVVERDHDLPPLARLLDEVATARARHASIVAAQHTEPRRAGACPGPPSGDEPDPRPAPASRERSAAGEVDGSVSSWTGLQRAFWSRLVPAGAGDARHGSLPDLLDDARPVRAARGMRVYGEAYAVTLRHALATNFPALARVVGAADFAALARAYLHRHPPRGHDVRRLGAGLAGFVRTYAFAEDYGVARDALADLVALEQAQLEVQDAVDTATTLAPAGLADLAPEQWAGTRFELVPAMRVVQATHDVLPVVEAVARGEVPVRPDRTPTGYLVWRSGDGVCTERLGAMQADLLAAMRAGRSVGAACDSVRGRSDAGEEAALVEAAVRLLVTACARGLLVRALPPEVAAG